MQGRAHNIIKNIYIYKIFFLKKLTIKKNYFTLYTWNVIALNQDLNIVGALASAFFGACFC